MRLAPPDRRGHKGCRPQPSTFRSRPPAPSSTTVEVQQAHVTFRAHVAVASRLATSLLARVALSQRSCNLWRSHIMG